MDQGPIPVSTEAQAARLPKKPYTAPRLRVLGTVAAITRSGNPGGLDFFGGTTV